MDPSLSISGDPHHPPPQFTPFPPFSTINPPPSHPLFGGPEPINQIPYNNHAFQPPPQTQSQPPQPSFNHPPYSEMICAAIAALNEPEGSSKMAISRYIERSNPDLHPSHGALLTHHLKSLKNSGVVSMVKKSYKLSASVPPESVAGLEVLRSENLPTNTVNDQQLPLDPASASQKRGRGRPPKPKPEANQQRQLVTVDSNGQSSLERFESPAVTNPTEGLQESVKRRPGRPRKNGASPIIQASVMAGIMKRRGRPPGRRAAGRQRKPKSVSSTASVFPYVVNGARRRGRPRRVDSIGTVAPTGGEIVAVAPGMKRGRGRPPKIGGVISRLMKPIRGRGRPVGRPRKVMLMAGAIGTQDSAYGELKRKFDSFQEKTREIVNVLKAGVTSNNEAVVQQAIHDLERLITVETVEPLQVVEVAQAEEAASQPHREAQNEGEEAQGDEQGQGGDAQTQTEAEAMQEALF